MGYSQNGSIKNFWPDDTDTEFYLVDTASLDEIIDGAKKRWGDDVDMSNINISSENIHTSCLTYDLYDPSDYTQFLRISLNK